MSAVLEAREPAAQYLEAAQPALVMHFDLLGKAPGGVSRLRELILTLAVQGKLAAQLPSDEPAALLLRRIESAKEQLVATGAMKRPKRLAEIAEDEQPFPVPTGWQWVRLGTLLQKIGAGSTPLGGKDVYAPSGVKFLRSQNVWNDGLRLEGVAHISPATHAKMAGTVVVANDLLFNITGASIGRCAAVPPDFDEANVSQHVTIVRPVLPSLSPFLHTVLISRLVQQAVLDVQVGVSREGLSIAKLANFLIPIPPIQEQARIVARVQKLMRLCDALDSQGRLEAKQHARLLGTLLGTLNDSSTPEELAANWQRVADHFDLLLDRPGAVDTLEQTILQLAVRGLLVPQDPSDEPASVLLRRSLGGGDRIESGGKPRSDAHLKLPASWEVTQLSDLCTTITDGEHATPERCDDPTQVPLVTAKNVRSEAMDYMRTDFVPRQAAERCWRRCKPEAGDILMVSVGATLGRLCILEEQTEMVLVRSVTLLRPAITTVNVNYLALHLMSPSTQSEIWGSVRQNAQPCLYLAKSAALRIALPPLREQARIVSRVTELRRLCADLRQRLTDSQTTQSRLAEALVAEVA